MPRIPEHQKTKICRCGKNMILRFTGQCFCTYPAQYPTYYWCGGCENREDGPTVRDVSEHFTALEDWKRAQSPIQ